MGGHETGSFGTTLRKRVVTKHEVTASALVSLREVTEDNLSLALQLQVNEAQKQFVASNTVSIAQA